MSLFALEEGQLGLGYSGISGPTYCSSVVRVLVCQPSGSGSNPGGIVQSQLLNTRGKTHLAAAYIHDLVL